MKTLDLNKNLGYKKGDLQNNIKDLKKKYGMKFIIKYKKFRIPVKFKENHMKLLGFSYLSLEYDLKKRTQYLLPFKIFFMDSTGNSYKLNNNVYIANIHKTDKISGSNMVQFVLELLNKLGTITATLHDGASVKCGNRGFGLSFFKFIEKKRGFYEKFGFRLTSRFNNNGKKNFPDNSTMYNLLYQRIDQLKKIKISYYIKIYNKILDLICNVIKKQDFDKVDIGLFGHSDIQQNNTVNDIIYVKQKDVKSKLLDLVSEINDLFEVLKKTKHTYLYKLMIELFNDPKKCSGYNQIMDYIIRNRLYMIKYGKNVIKIDYKYIFKNIFDIKHMTMLRYDF